MTILLFIIILAVLILAHELGHFLASKYFGVRVDEFGLGFPPKIFGKKYGETEYTVNALPIGGFVRIFGENPDEVDEASLKNKRCFAAKPKFVQAIILCAGVFFNLLLAWLLLSVGLMTGLPAGPEEAAYRKATFEDAALTVTSVAKKSPAEYAGLENGDKILSLRSDEDTLVSPSSQALQSFIGSREGKTITMNISRQNKTSEIKVVPESGIVAERAAIGISMDMVGTMRLPFWRSVYMGGEVTLFYIKMTFVGLYALLRDSIIGRPDFSGVAGPVGIVKVVGTANALGTPHLILLVSLISINLAVVNILPIPALDGGRLLFLAIEAIKGKPLKKRTINLAHMIGYAVLMGLIIAVTFHDIWKIFAE